MVKKIIVTLLFAVGIVAIIISTRPAEFRYQRKAAMSAPAAAVFAQVNDLHKWHTWSPWAKMDPNAKETFSGPASGVGARMSWAGNNKVGEGSMTITDSRPNEIIRFKLEFLKPFPATQSAEFTFQRHAQQTIVTWTMFGQNNFIGKAMGLVMDCDKMIGGEFDKGLAQLKAIVETGRKS